MPRAEKSAVGGGDMVSMTEGHLEEPGWIKGVKLDW